jgi:glucan phosphoethanolaminetransferase (alkaline phosphatase superfamily)
MRNANRLWQIAFLAASSAFIIESVDCITAGCGPGTLVLASRASAISALVAGLAAFAGAYLFHGRNIKLQFVTSLVLLAPLAVTSGVHAASTATLTRILPESSRPWLISAVFMVSYSSYFLLLLRWRQCSPTRLIFRGFAVFGCLVTAIGLFSLAAWLKKLHYPLATAALFFCWLNLQMAMESFLPSLSVAVARIGVWGFLSLGLTMTLWPVSLEDSFIASDQGILARDLTSLGRSHTVEELVQHTRPQVPRPPEKHWPTKESLPQRSGQSVVLISVDALRPDHLSFNGYRRNTSPNIDALLRQSVVFDAAYAVSPTSSFSIPAIHTGMLMEERLKSAAPLPPLLAARLSSMGYRTIGLYPQKIFSVGPALMQPIRDRQFGFQQTELLSMDAQKDVQTALAHLRQHPPGTPLFMWIHFYDPHLPYTCHDTPFGSEAADCYDAEISWLDRHLPPLLREIETRLDNPIIVFTADHGEAFGEHGRFYHSTDLYDEQIRVPLAFRVPGVPSSRVKTSVSNSFIFDTLLSLVAPGNPTHHNDLRPYLRSARKPMPVVSMMGDRRSLVFENHKLICQRWPRGACALFNLTSDPGENENIAGRNLPRMVELLGLLKSYSEMELDQLRHTAPEAIILGRLKRSEAIPGLMKLAQDPSSPFVIEATRLLALLKNRSTGDTLETLLTSRVPEVAAWAAVGCSLVHTSFDPDILYPFLNDDTDLGNWSRIALGRSGNHRAFAPLLKMLTHDEPELRALAALALGELGDPQAVPALISLLDIKQSRWAAIEALGELKDRRAIPILNKLKENEPDISNLPRYERAIAHIEQK